jgi:hypothetical protein
MKFCHKSCLGLALSLVLQVLLKHQEPLHHQSKNLATSLEGLLIFGSKSTAMQASIFSSSFDTLRVNNSMPHRQYLFSNAYEHIGDIGV